MSGAVLTHIGHGQAQAEADDFTERVDYVAAVISAGRPASRRFDGVFESHDGDEIATALVRRAENNPRLAANLFDYVDKGIALAAAERLREIPTRDLARVAAETRAKAIAAFEEQMRSWAKESAL